MPAPKDLKGRREADLQVLRADGYELTRTLLLASPGRSNQFVIAVEPQRPAARLVCRTLAAFGADEVVS